MKYLIRFAVIIAACFVASGAYAQQLKVATGSASGTYSKMLKELTGKCTPTGLAIIEANTTGSSENIDMLVGNQVNAAFVQSDVLYLRARTEELGNVKTLLALHPEAVHIVVKAGAGVKQGGVMGVGGTHVPFTMLEDLAGRRIGASGGSQVTAQVIRLQSEIPFNVEPFDKADDLLAALAGGKIDAALFVGGQPLGTVAQLGAGYRLLGIAPTTIEKLKGVYRPARLNYRTMGAAGVPTVSTDALFVTRSYTTERMVGSLAALRACAQASLGDLKETTGTHPAWQAVEADNKGKWAWYDLPAPRK